MICDRGIACNWCQLSKRVKIVDVNADFHLILNYICLYPYIFRGSIMDELTIPSCLSFDSQYYSESKRIRLKFVFWAFPLLLALNVLPWLQIMGMAWTHASICIPRLLNKTGAVLQSADAVLHSAGEVLQSAGAVLNSASAVHPLFGLSSLLLYCNCYGLMPPFLDFLQLLHCRWLLGKGLKTRLKYIPKRGILEK